MRPPSAAQSRAGAVAPAPRGFPVVACPDSIARDTRCLLLTHTSIKSYMAASSSCRYGLWVGSERLGFEKLASGAIEEGLADIPSRGDLEPRVPTFSELVPALD